MLLTFVKEENNTAYTHLTDNKFVIHLELSELKSVEMLSIFISYHQHFGWKPPPQAHMGFYFYT